MTHTESDGDAANQEGNPRIKIFNTTHFGYYTGTMYYRYGITWITIGY